VKKGSVPAHPSRIGDAIRLAIPMQSGSRREAYGARTERASRSHAAMDRDGPRSNPLPPRR
jgi:hypothetical protein